MAAQTAATCSVDWTPVRLTGPDFQRIRDVLLTGNARSALAVPQRHWLRDAWRTHERSADGVTVALTSELAGTLLTGADALDPRCRQRLTAALAAAGLTMGTSA